MSNTMRAMRETESGLLYLGLDPRDVGKDELTSRVFKSLLNSILEFGPDTVHPTTVDDNNTVSVQGEI